jgi:hypothetical protein
MKVKANVMTAALALLALLGSGAAAAEISWWYADANYQTTEDNDADGIDFEISGHVRPRWVLQGRYNSLTLDDDSAEVTQKQFDLLLGRVFRLSRNVEAMVGGGYTYVDYDADLQLANINVEESSDLGNVKAALRAEFWRRFDAELSLGLLFDDEDTSDLLWSTALRYHLGDHLALHLGVRGSDQDYSYDDVVYELGFRFDLKDPE